MKRFGYTEHPVYKTGQLKKSSIHNIKKSSELYTSDDPINYDVLLKDITEGNASEKREKTMGRFTSRAIKLPRNRSYISTSDNKPDEKTVSEPVLREEIDILKNVRHNYETSDNEENMFLKQKRTLSNREE